LKDRIRTEGGAASSLADRIAVDSMMKVTIAVCTRNRGPLLRQTLERMSHVLRVPAGVEWEVLVVDNGSADDTAAVLVAQAPHLPLRTVLEPVPGLSPARNRAVAEARGDYILWTDDDVLVDAGWLEAYAAAFARHPEAAVFGGPIEPSFPTPPPAWLERIWPHVASAYAVRDLGPAEVPLTPGTLPYGANYAVRAAEQRRHLYSPRLGNRPEVRTGGEETIVLRSLLASGSSGRWVPEARVAHQLPVERQTLEYLRGYYYGRGRRLHLDAEGHAGLRWGVPGWVAQFVAAELAYRSGRMLDLPDLWARGLRRSWIARGYLSGLRPGGRP
jgi:glucosyl-dolichyl phosphate glucuronosyltransferase